MIKIMGGKKQNLLVTNMLVHAFYICLFLIRYLEGELFSQCIFQSMAFSVKFPFRQTYQFTCRQQCLRITIHSLANTGYC